MHTTNILLIVEVNQMTPGEEHLLRLIEDDVWVDTFQSKLKKKTSEEISKVTGGIELPPGFKLPF